MKGIVILCEGRHDTAFVSKMLEIAGYKHYSSKKNITIDKMEQPLKGLFINKLKNYQYESKRLLQRPILPWIMLKQGQGNVYALIYSMDGIDKKENYKEIIEEITDLNWRPNDEESLASELTQENSFSLVFIVDADNKGIEFRVKQIIDNYKNLIPELEELGHGSGKIVTKTDFKAVGCFVLTDSRGVNGNLEDIILPIMKDGNYQIFEDAELFLTKHNFIRYKKDGETKDELKTASDFKKSVIGIAGQIDNSGFSNNEIIKQTKFLNKDKMKQSDIVKDFISYINKIRNLTKK